jgi:cytosine/adenosine deaminase-related metal-dependent hydrolase
MGEIHRLDGMGCLAANTVLVHAVGMTDRDVELVTRRRASVVWCPHSNLELFGSTLDPRRIFAAGRIALGTDSRLTGARDLLDELRVARDHSDLLPVELFRLVTSNAATVLRLARANGGGGEPNPLADCLILRDQADAYRALVDARRADVRAVVRGGVPLVADPDLGDWLTHSGADPVAAVLDGRPKVVARQLARSDVAALEHGLEIC